MKKMTKFLALVLALALVFSLAACSKQGSGIAGTWKYTLDFKKAMEVSGEEAEAGLDMFGEDFVKSLENLNIIMVLDLKSDNTYNFYIDENSARAAVDGMISKMTEIMPSLLMSMSGMSEDELNAALAEQGMSMDDMIKQMTDEMDTEEMMKSITEASSKGTWRFADGKLYLTEEGGVENPAEYVKVELNGNELRITEVAEGTGFDEYKALLPLVFVR